MGQTHAFIVAIENYQQKSIKPVHFAAEDAKAFKAALIQSLKVPEENIQVWIDSEATQNRLLNDLPYDIRQLGPDDKFIFFYAGHGFFAKGVNRLSAWDTHPANLEDSTVNVDQVLLGPLKASRCSRALVFVDACAAGLREDHPYSRDMLTDMSSMEFDEFLKSSAYSAAFFSCSPMEKSYSAEKLRHGIWSYFLLKALVGEDSGAVQRDRWITGESLKNYLTLSVQKFIREETDIRETQRPYAVLSGNGPVEIVQVPEPATTQSLLSHVIFRFAETRFRGIEVRPFKNMDGFEKKRGNTVPTSATASANSWAKRLVKNELESELEETKARAKRVLAIGRQGILLKFDDDAGGSIDTDYFRLSIDAGQDQEAPENIAVRREVTLRVPHDQLPKDFDSIFSRRVHEMIVPIELSGGNYEKVANSLESFAIELGADFDEKESEGVITITFSQQGPEITFDYSQQELRIGGPFVSGCTALIGLVTGSIVTSVLGSTPPLLGAPRQKSLR